MDRISKIYTEFNSMQDMLSSCLNERRPKIKMDFDLFSSKITDYGTFLMAKRGVNEIFRLDEIGHEVLKNLYLYGIYDSSGLYDIDKGIVMEGSYGRSKTVLLQAFTNILYDQTDPFELEFMSSVRFAKAVSENSNIINSMVKRPLIIDDIGKEPKKVKSFGSEVQPLIDLVVERYEEGSISFFTTNFNLETLNNHYGEYFSQRLDAMSNWIKLEGKSLRR